MGELGVKKRGKAWLTVLLAFLLPGMGHVYNGQHSKGFLLLAGLLLNYMAIFRLADLDGGRHLLLIVYLCLMLPVFYFISVFDALQSIERSQTNHSSIRLYHGICLMAAGLIMLIFIQPPTYLMPWMSEFAEWSVGPLLMLAALLLTIPIRRGAIAMFKLGRLTAGLLIITVGTLLIWDLLQDHHNKIALLGKWWPITFIILGLEIILYCTVLRHKSSKLRLDFAGLSAALVITLTAYSVTQYADFPVRWLDQFNVDLNGKKDYAEESGFRYDKNVVKMPFTEELSSIRIVNVNGDITVRTDDVKEIELYTTIWVDEANRADALMIANKSEAIISPGNETSIEGKGYLYGVDGNRLPKMNMEIVIPIIELADTSDIDKETAIPEGITPTPSASPETNVSPEIGTEVDASSTTSPTTGSTNQDSDVYNEHTNTSNETQSIKLEIESKNGAVLVSGVNAQSGISIKSSSGLVKIDEVHGAVNVVGNNGSIEAYTISGDTTLVTKNGSIIAGTITDGNLFTSTLNGDLELMHIDGDLDAETKNGKINITEAKSSLKADTLNGSIEVESSDVGGNWDIDSSVGEIKLIVPTVGHYSVYGSVTFGNITTDLPFEQSRKSISGTVGEGTYRIHINATNSISILRQET